MSLKAWWELQKCKVAARFLGYETEYCRNLRLAEEAKKAKGKR